MEDDYWICMNGPDPAWFCAAKKATDWTRCLQKFEQCLSISPEMWCGGALIVVGGVICCADTPAPGPCDVPGGAVAGAGCAIIGIPIHSKPNAKGDPHGPL
jgi:hypothetical protein